MLTGLLTLGAIAIGLIAGKKTATGIGRIKRRIYVEMEAAQQLGVDFEQKYMDLSNSQKNSLEEVGTRFGWKQSKRSVESGKPYSEAYFNSLKRAYNAISGIVPIGAPYYTSHSVRNGDGHVILTWRDYAPAEEHIQAETNLEELEEKLRKQRNRLRKSGALKDMVLEPAPNLQEEEPANTNYVPEMNLTKQQQILELWPYLRTYDSDVEAYEEQPDGTQKSVYPVVDNFNFVIWKKIKNSSGQTLAEGPVMAFINRQGAENNLKSFKIQGKGKNISFTIKSVADVKLDRIAGIGYIDFTI